ncbi:MAG: GGDEF domain-containing protein [Actinomycetota bacterium]
MARPIAAATAAVGTAVLAVGVSATPALAVPAPESADDTVELLTDALDALQAGDTASYRLTVEELTDGHWLPTAGWEALQDVNLDDLVFTWMLLESIGDEIIALAFEQVMVERDLASIFDPTAIELAFLDDVDADGVTILEVMDHRGLPISPEARAVLAPLDGVIPVDPTTYDIVLAKMSARLAGPGAPGSEFAEFDDLGMAGLPPLPPLPPLTPLGPPPFPAAEEFTDPPIDEPDPDGLPTEDTTATPDDTLAPAAIDDTSTVAEPADEMPAPADATVRPATTVAPPMPGTTGDGVGGQAWLLVVIGLAVGALATTVLTFRRHRDTDRLVDYAFTDALTGLGNRRRLDDDLAAQRRRGPCPTSVLMIDIDHFKQFNDQYGHAAGDRILRAVADTIATNVRTGDVPYRYGGEEFSVLLPDTSATQAAEVAERIRDAIERATIDLPDGESASVTVSIGLSSGPATSVTRLVDRADEALYQAKQTGRNRLILR